MAYFENNFWGYESQYTNQFETPFDYYPVQYSNPPPPPQENFSFEERVLQALHNIEVGMQSLHTQTESIAKLETHMEQITNALSREEEILFQISTEDPLQECQTHFGFDDFDIEKSVEEVNSLLESAPLTDLHICKAKFEPFIPPSNALEFSASESLSLLSSLAFPSIEEPPISETIPLVSSSHALNVESESISLDHKVTILDKVETSSMVISTQVDRINEQVISELGGGDNELKWDFIIGIDYLIPTEGVRLQIVLFKNTYPWSANAAGVLVGVNILNGFVEQMHKFVFEVKDFHWNDPSIINYKKRIRIVS